MVLNKKVLVLNRAWLPLSDKKTVQDAIVGMFSKDDANPPFLALDIGYEEDEDGNPIFSKTIYMNPLPWEEWIKLPIRKYDDVVRTAKFQIRAPTVIIANNYDKMPTSTLRPTKDGIRRRDGDTCQVSGKKLVKNQGSVDHGIPKSRGGKDTWENLVWMDKELNFKKGDRTLEEMGWKLIKEPRAPKAVPFSALIREAKHHDWLHFIK